MKVIDLKPNQSATFRARVLTKGPEKTMSSKKYAGLKVCEFTIADDTGAVMYTCFNDEIPGMTDAVNKVIDLASVWVKYYNGKLQLTKGKAGTWRVVDDPSFPAAGACKTGTSAYTPVSDEERVAITRASLYKTIWSPKIKRKIGRAGKMLGKEGSVLHVAIKADEIIAVVKSQTDENKEYATMITKDGEYQCFDRDMNHCLGLQGSMCKHVILTILAAAKASSHKMDELQRWTRSAIFNEPRRRKKEAERIFAEYELSKIGKVEWRPVLLLPEDLMAL